MFLYIPFVIFVMLGTTNAVNLTDGIDGLSTSISAIITTCLTVIAIILDIKEIIVFGSIIVGACLGFLIFNLNTAKVFMGDTGSLALGLVMVLSPAMLQPVMKKITKNDSVALGHFSRTILMILLSFCSAFCVTAQVFITHKIASLSIELEEVKESRVTEKDLSIKILAADSVSI